MCRSTLTYPTPDSGLTKSEIARLSVFNAKNIELGKTTRLWWFLAPQTETARIKNTEGNGKKNPSGK